MVEDLQDPRRHEPTQLLGEREMLEGWLEFHRFTLLLKCEGLDDEMRKGRPVPTSALSLHGLVRHMADVERGWFRRCLTHATPEELPYLFYDPRLGEDSDFFPLDDADWESDLATWQQECEAARAEAAGRSLEDTGDRDGVPISLRWIYTHMIEEYARHNGHADLIRELLDGSTGW